MWCFLVTGSMRCQQPPRATAYLLSQDLFLASPYLDTFSYHITRVCTGFISVTRHVCQPCAMSRQACSFSTRWVTGVLQALQNIKVR